MMIIRIVTVKKKNVDSNNTITAYREFSSRDVFDSKFNSILWDIEDIIHLLYREIKNSVYRRADENRHIADLLIFVDRWILAPVGLIDYFVRARGLKDLDPKVFIDRMVQRNSRICHFPFSSTENYFFDIRELMNLLLRKYETYDLMKKIEDKNVIIIESWINAQHFALYYVSGINGSIKNDYPFENRYHHSNECFSFW